MEYLDRFTPPNPALYLQRYNLFVVEPILKKRREDGEKIRNKRSDKKEPGNSRKKEEREK